MGTYQLSFAGGEPLLYSDLLEIVDYASSLGVITSLVTSGSVLTPRKLDELKRSNIDAVNISLDSVKPRIHDEIRGVKGVHKKVMNAIEELCNAGLHKKIIVATVLMASNLDEIIPLAQFAKEKKLFGISYQVLTDNFGRTYQHNWFLKSKDFVKDLAKFEKITDDLLELKRKGYPILNAKRQLEYSRQYFRDPTKPFPFRCKVGFNNLRIGPNGDVQFCNLSKPFGNIQNLSPKELWRNSLAQRRRRELRLCQMSCSIQNCYFKKSIAENINSFMKKWK